MDLLHRRWKFLLKFIVIHSILFYLTEVALLELSFVNVSEILRRGPHSRAPRPENKCFLGENGVPAEIPNITDQVEKLIELSWTKYGFNEYLSSLISVHRTLPDLLDD